MAKKQALPRNQPPASERYRKAAAKVRRAAKVIESAANDLDGLAWGANVELLAETLENVARRLDDYAITSP